MTDEPRDDEDERPTEEMRESGVGTADPDIVGDTEPGPVDDEIGDKEPEV